MMYWKYQVKDFGIFVLLCVDDVVFLMFYFLDIKRNKEMYGFCYRRNIIYLYVYVYILLVLFKINWYFILQLGFKVGGIGGVSVDRKFIYSR